MRDWRIRTALDKYGQGSITLLKAAEIAGTSIYEMIALLEKRRMPYRYDISDLEEYMKRRYGVGYWTELAAVPMLGQRSTGTLPGWYFDEDLVFPL
jgi:hypothetical protein